MLKDKVSSLDELLTLIKVNVPCETFHPSTKNSIPELLGTNANKNLKTKV